MSHPLAQECHLTVALATDAAGARGVALQIAWECGHVSFLPLTAQQARETAAAMFQCAAMADGGGGVQ